MTYEDYVGRYALESVGKKKWTKRVQNVIENTKLVWNWDLLHLGGGNAKLLKDVELPDTVRLHSNKSGVMGGFVLWQDV